jgi:SET domain
MLEIRQTSDRGRGLFTTETIREATRILPFSGRVLPTAELTDDLLAMQVGPDEWLCSDGEQPDDCANHSCDPNAGFRDGQVALFALRDIAAGEEITWDYSTSIGWPGWSLDCRCGSPACRGTVRSWGELTDDERTRLAPTALDYLTGATG